MVQSLLGCDSSFRRVVSNRVDIAVYHDLMFLFWGDSGTTNPNPPAALFSDYECVRDSFKSLYGKNCRIIQGEMQDLTS